MAASFGKIPTTSVLRLILPLRCSSELVLCSFGAMLRREGHIGDHASLGRVHQNGELGHRRPELISDPAPLRLAAGASSCANAVAMKAETTRRPERPAWASAFFMRWTRQRCQFAVSTFETAAYISSSLSETTSLTPRRQRLASLRRNAVQMVSASEGANIRAHLAPSVAVDADVDDDQH